MLNNDTFTTIKKQASSQGISFKEHLNNLLKLALKIQSKPEPYKFEWKTTKGRRQPAVDISDRDRLYDFMDGDKC